jgi:putative ATPase
MPINGMVKFHHPVFVCIIDLGKEMNTLLRSFSFTNAQIEIVEGDLTHETVDAIVNAANSHLMHGGGVAAAIVDAGGWVIQQESDDWVKKYGEIKHNKPAYTNAGNLLCKYVIHAVGPVWGEGNEDEKLASAIEGSLKLAEQLKLTSVAFPSISTGIFGFPRKRAAGIFYDVLKHYFENNPTSTLKKVRLVLFGQSAAQEFLDIFTERINPIEPQSNSL